MGLCSFIVVASNVFNDFFNYSAWVLLTRSASLLVHLCTLLYCRTLYLALDKNSISC